MFLFIAAAFAASPCRIRDEATLMRLSEEFLLAESANRLVLHTPQARYHRKRVTPNIVELTIVTVNEQPVSISYFYTSVQVSVRGRIRAAWFACADARRTLDAYLLATAIAS